MSRDVWSKRVWGRTYISLCATKFNISLLVARVEDVYWCIWHFYRFGVWWRVRSKRFQWLVNGCIRVSNGSFSVGPLHQASFISFNLLWIWRPMKFENNLGLYSMTVSCRLQS
jgi:hypothetical protein